MKLNLQFKEQFTKLLNYLSLALSYCRFNLKAQYEYRTAFFMQAGGMFINDCIWLAYFTLFFTAFPVVKGWHATDVAILWAVTAAGFGIGHGLFGNSLQLAQLIARGELDVWLLYPRSLLPHLLLGKMHASSIGDAVFGYAAYLFLLRPDLPHFVLFALLTLSVALLFVGFSIITGSLAFFLGNTDGLSENWRGALIAFSSYPMDIFGGPAKFLLFTFVPAGFVSGFPIEALRQMSLLHAAYSLAGASTIALLSIVIFYLGLRRYESGNMVSMRG